MDRLGRPARSVEKIIIPLLSSYECVIVKLLNYYYTGPVHNVHLHLVYKKPAIEIMQ